MALPSHALLRDDRAVRAAMAPLRRRMLEELREPHSAVTLAERLGIPRQKVGYHLKALEEAGLIRLHEERRKRGFTERVMVAAAEAFVIDPGALDAGEIADVETQDRHASGHLIRTASEVVREVARMKAAADEAGQRLLTFTIEADVSLTRPADFDALADDLTRAVAEVARRYADPEGRRYRLMACARPASKSAKPPTSN